MPIPDISELPAAGDISPTDLRRALAAAAEMPPNPMLRAAVHLFCATHAVYFSEIDSVVDINAEIIDGTDNWCLVARPRWDRITGALTLRLSHADTVLVEAARSLANNRMVSLAETCTGLPSSHAHALVQAIRIATGLDGSHPSTRTAA